MKMPRHVPLPAIAYREATQHSLLLGDWERQHILRLVKLAVYTRARVTKRMPRGPTLVLVGPSPPMDLLFMPMFLLASNHLPVKNRSTNANFRKGSIPQPAITIVAGEFKQLLPVRPPSQEP